MADGALINERRRWLTCLLLLGLWSLMACRGTLESPSSLVATATPAHSPPTPTLALGVATLIPTAAVPTAPPPTATVPSASPHEALERARRAWHNGDSQTAANRLQAALADPQTTAAQRAEALYWLGRAASDNGDVSAAVQAFRDQLASAVPDPKSYFHLGQLNLAAGNCPIAVQELSAYVAQTPSLGAYVYPDIATCATTSDEVVAAYQQALDSPAHYLVHVVVRRQLASHYLQQGRPAEAIAQYRAIREMARTEITKGEMTYLIGATYLQLGDSAAGYEAFQVGVQQYPRAYESYLGLVELVEAEQPVEAYQRGLVDYYAAVYTPAIAAFQQYLQQIPSGYRPDTHLYLAWSYEALGDVDKALDHLAAYLAVDPQNPEVLGRYYEEKAALETRSISVAQAIETLDAWGETAPTHPRAAWAAWRSAVLADRFRGDGVEGAARYAAYATAYPTHEFATEAQFRAGMLAYEQGDLDTAWAAWRVAAEQVADPFGRAARLWLLLSLPEDQARAYQVEAAEQVADYYSLRARDVSAGWPAYAPANTFTDSFDEAAGRREVEQWLRTHFGLAPEAVVQSALAPGLAADARLIRGTELWQLGLSEAAKRELEAVRLDYAGNAQLSYQLALYFRDLGLYRSSILAAASVLTRANVSVFEAPPLIGRLAYPIYYDDLIVPLAAQYGLDPLLLFALVRQESLYEGFATSSAAAQGLGQVIPETGVFVAQRLAWPDYDNRDLYRPHVNLTFAAYYLHLQQQSFGDLTAAALAAYNAGPGNAAQWQALVANQHDQYVETINFSETRAYVRHIYVWQAVYRYLYGS